MLATITAVVVAATMTTAPTADNTWRVDRPDRGTHGSVVREAAVIPPKWKPFAKCVAFRESGVTNLDNRQSREDARNSSSSAAGRWQMLRAWQQGGSFMVRDRLVQFGMPKQDARHVRLTLGDTPIHEWDGWLQDVLFNEAIARGGWRHWSGGKGCNSLVP